MAVSKAVLITGCSTGIGAATAKHLAAKGWTVYATARRLDSIAELENAGCRILELDVLSEESMKTAVGKVEAAEGAVGVLVNNAGYSLSGAVETISMDDLRKQFETNVFGLTRMCQLVLPAMRAQGWGRIVNISSMGGRLTFPGGAAYHGTKFAVEAISDVLRFEVRKFGVDVVLIEPGLIRTEFAATASATIEGARGDGDYARFNDAVAKVTSEAYDGPFGKLGGGPETVAKAIEKAITSRRPRTRYTVTPSAKLILGTRRLLTDRAWDRFVKSNYPQPGA